MADFKETLANLKKGPADVLGIEIEPSETRIVRLKKGGDQIDVVGAAVLPPVDTDSEASSESSTGLAIPPKLKAKYGAITVQGSESVIKLLSFPGKFDQRAESKLVDNLGLEEPDNFRVSYKMITEGSGKAESRVLTVALPEADARVITQVLPSGLPAPYSLEVAGLATMSAFLHGPAVNHADEAVGAMHFGTNTSTYTLYFKNTLSLIRRFNVGTDSVLDKVQETLGVDRDTAEGIITDGAFDISQSVTEVMEPLIKQLIVSRDFVERRENCHIAKLYVSGGLTASRDSLDEMRSAMGLEIGTWSPFDNLNVAPDAIPEEFKGKEWIFAAGTGAALAIFEDT